jgi:hypothetical protein
MNSIKKKKKHFVVFIFILSTGQLFESKYLNRKAVQCKMFAEALEILTIILSLFIVMNVADFG